MALECPGSLGLGVVGLFVAWVRRDAAVLERDLRLSAERLGSRCEAPLSRSRYSSEVIL